MRRVWFKKDMRQAILEGRKTSTTRYRPLPVDKVNAVGGSRFKAEIFATLEITDRIPTTWRKVIEMFYREEGFESPEAMLAFGKKEKLIDPNLLDEDVFFHRFKLIKADVI